MPIVSSPSAARSPGVYGILVAPPRVIRGVSLGYIGYIGMFDAGPVGTGYLPEDGDDLVQTYEPRGVPRKKSGWYGIIGQLSAPWFIVGVKGTGYATATTSQAGTGGNVVATAKSPGVWANAITWQIAAASNGDATARDHIFTLTDSVTKTTSETYRNVAMNQDMTALLVNSRLLASLVFSGGTMTAWPANGTVSLGGTTAGSDGSALAATDYQNALDQLALEENVTVVVTDDCGDAIRAAVNTDVQTHCTNLYNRVCFLSGNKGNTWTQTKTDKENYTSELATYCGMWVQVYDDSGTTLVDVPLHIFCGVIRVNVPVHWSIANHDPQATKYLQNIKGVSTTNYSVASSTIRDEATDAQIVLPIQGVGPQPGTKGPWQLLHGRDCNLTSGYQFECVTWYRIYVVRSVAPQLDTYINGPNDLNSGLEIQGIVNTWLQGEENAGHLTQSLDPTDSTKLLPAWSTDIQGVNSGATMALGDFYIQIDGHHPGVRERIFILVNVGETVSVRRAAA